MERLATICAQRETLGLGVRMVRDTPGCRQIGDRGVHEQECAIDFTLQVDGLSCSGEDAKAIVGFWEAAVA